MLWPEAGMLWGLWGYSGVTQGCPEGMQGCFGVCGVAQGEQRDALRGCRVTLGDWGLLKGDARSLEGDSGML